MNFEDFALLAASWQEQAGGQSYNELFDLADDNVINLQDLRMFTSEWLSTESEP